MSGRGAKGGVDLVGAGDMIGSAVQSFGPGKGAIRVASWPRTSQPYVDLFYRALEPYGIHVVHDLRIDVNELRSYAQSLDAVHIHWPESIWRYRGSAIPWRLRHFASLRGIDAFRRYLRLARRFGVRILWTVHNIEHHEGSNLVDRCGYLLLARHADLVICHSNWCRDEVLARYGRKPETTIVMPHGNYDGVFPRASHRESTLARIGLPTNSRTLLCFGLIRSYKGFDLAIEAVRQLGDGYQLIIAGQALSTRYGERLFDEARHLRNVRLIMERVDDQQLADLVHASDCVLLPYRQVTGSGVLLTALTLERAVIVSDLPYFREVLSREPDAGVLFPPSDAHGLTRAVETFFELPLGRRIAAARSLADRFDWADVTKPVVAWLRREFATLAHTPTHEALNPPR